MNSIFWKGISSTTIPGLLICDLPPISKPKMRTKETKIDGRDGSIVEELGYESYTKTVSIGLRSDFDINKVIKYFTGEGELVFSNEIDKIYNARIVERIDFERLIRFKKAKVKFLVQPYKYKRDEVFKETEVATALGTSIVLNDSANANLSSFSIYGKSMLNGTPTPYAPADIVSIADDGSLEIKILGKNIINIVNGKVDGFDIVNDGTKIIISGTNANSYAMRLKLCDVKLFANQQYCLSGGVSADNSLVVSKTMDTFDIVSNGNAVKYTATEDSTMGVYLRINPGQTLREFTIFPQLEEGDVATEYEPYSSQTITVNETLRAVPVTDKNIATYTDASGQMWCADEIDLKRGCFIRRIQRITFDQIKEVYRAEHPTGSGIYRFNMAGTINNPIVNVKFLSHNFGLSNALTYSNSVVGNNSVDNCISVYYIGGIYARCDSIASAEEFLTTARSENWEVLGILETPIETPLTEEQIVMSKNLKSNGQITITNDENAFMRVGYFKPYEVFNEGLESSRPLMVLKGSGTVEISVNGTGIFSYTFPEGENEVVIDSEKEDAYLGSVLKNRNMNGEFPILLPKTNIIEWSGDVESIEILPRSRWL